MSDILGTWNNDSTYENLEIRESGDVFDNRLGQGRIAFTSDNAANVTFVFQGDLEHPKTRQCWYYATLLGGHLRLAARNGPDAAADCQKGSFTRVPLSAAEQEANKAKNFETHMALGDRAASANDGDLAIQEYEKARDIDSESGRPLFAEGNILLAKKDFLSAIDRYTLAIKKNNNSGYIASRCIAKSWIAADYNSAIEDANNSISLEPNNGLAFYCRGSVYLLQGRSDAALTDMQKASSLLPTDERIKNKLIEIANIEAKNSALAESIGRQESPYKGPPELKDVDILYFSRPKDYNAVNNALDSMHVTYSTRESKELRPSNQITCTSDVSIEAVKTLAKNLIAYGIDIFRIKKSDYPNLSNRLTIESDSYPNREPISMRSIELMEECDLIGIPNNSSR